MEKRIGKLKTALQIAEESRLVYKEARRDKISDSKCRTLMSALNTVSSLTFDSDMEDRIAAIEEHIEENK